MLRVFGVELEVEAEGISLDGGQVLHGGRAISVPADISSAAFFLAGAAMVDGSELTLTDVGINPTRTGVIDILRQMGADITLSHERSTGSEPLADITVRGSRLRGIEVPPRLVPSAIDEFPILFVAAACAEGVTRLAGASELRHKESDRIEVMAAGLRTLGVEVTTTNDGIEIVGRGSGLKGGCIDSRGDHRVAMAFAIAGLRATEPVEITDCAAIETSFPGFTELAHRVGLDTSHG
jgi:3-phosphoshikimate 1-carboxyvinyltransferase